MQLKSLWVPPYFKFHQKQLIVTEGKITWKLLWLSPNPLPFPLCWKLGLWAKADPWTTHSISFIQCFLKFWNLCQHAKINILHIITGRSESTGPKFLQFPREEAAALFRVTLNFTGSLPYPPPSTPHSFLWDFWLPQASAPDCRSSSRQHVSDLICPLIA